MAERLDLLAGDQAAIVEVNRGPARFGYPVRNEHIADADIVSWHHAVPEDKATLSARIELDFRGTLTLADKVGAVLVDGDL